MEMEPKDSKNDTPWKINMEAENDGLLQMIFLFQLGDVWIRAMLIFRGVSSPWNKQTVRTFKNQRLADYFLFWDGLLFKGLAGLEP